MIEYFKKKLELLLDSVLEPLWKWVMAASLKVRITILLLCGFVCGAVAYPDIPGKLYVLANSTTRAALAEPQKIPISSEITEKARSTVKRLSSTIEGDLLKLGSGHLTPWSAAQASVAVAGVETANFDNDAIKSFFRSNTVPDCACWTEIPEKKADSQCIFISGWIMTALADINIPATSEEIRYALDAQDKDGWWPTFHVAKQSHYASTYSTAWVLIGLLRQKNKGFISGQDAVAVDNAVVKATGWLLSVRGKGARWKPYPRLSLSGESESISGLVLHALHISAPNQVAALDKEWIDNLPITAVAASDGENYYVEMKGTNPQAIDHFVQLKAPWMLIATIDAYANGDLFQRAKALLWLERTLNHESFAIADADENNWWRAEILYGMRYALKHRWVLGGMGYGPDAVGKRDNSMC